MPRSQTIRSMNILYSHKTILGIDGLSRNPSLISTKFYFLIYSFLRSLQIIRKISVRQGSFLMISHFVR